MELGRIEEAKPKRENLDVLLTANGPLATFALCFILLDEKDEAEQMRKSLKATAIYSRRGVPHCLGDYGPFNEYFFQVEYWESLVINHFIS